MAICSFCGPSTPATPTSSSGRGSRCSSRSLQYSRPQPGAPPCIQQPDSPLLSVTKTSRQTCLLDQGRLACAQLPSFWTRRALYLIALATPERRRAGLRSAPAEASPHPSTSSSSRSTVFSSSTWVRAAFKRSLRARVSSSVRPSVPACHCQNGARELLRFCRRAVLYAFFLLPPGHSQASHLTIFVTYIVSWRFVLARAQSPDFCASPVTSTALLTALTRVGRPQDFLSSPPWERLVVATTSDQTAEFCVGMLRFLRVRPALPSSPSAVAPWATSSLSGAS